MTATPADALTAFIKAAGDFWTGASVDSRAFDAVMRCDGRFIELCRLCGYEAEEIADEFCRWIESHEAIDE